MSLPDLSTGGPAGQRHAWGATSQHPVLCIQRQTLRFPEVKMFLAHKPNSGDMHGSTSRGQGSGGHFLVPPVGPE